MTDKVNVFNKAGAAIQGATGYRRGMERVRAFDLAKAFKPYGITFDDMNGFPGQNEK